MSTETLTQPLKWHGGKAYLADWIIGHMPPRVTNSNSPAPDDPGWLHYVEPFAGGLAVLLANDPNGISEVVSDVNGELMNFWAVLQDEKLFRQLKRRVEAVPFSEIEYDAASVDPPLTWDKQGGMMALAVNFFIRCRMSMSGRMDAFAPLTRNRTRRGMNEQVSAWLNAIDGLPDVHSRLKRVVMIDGSAIDVIQQQDGPRTLFYLDPPYLHATRTASDVYAFEMSTEQHQALLECLTRVKGRFILSGYRSDLYDAYADLHRWRLVEREIDNKSAKGASKQKRVECLWMNY